MKVLSIKEPYATLIKNGIKKIETRSYKTNYMGELYIHASLKMYDNYQDNKELLPLIKNYNFKLGYIICKCKLIDCLYMTEEFIEDIKENNYSEYICGDYKVGRYAWILDDIEVLNNPISAKGSLGIWNYYSDECLLDMMKDIKYGYLSSDKKKYFDFSEFASLYRLQSPKEIIKSRLGVCFDQVELERYYLSRSYSNIKTYFIINYHEDISTHTFLTYEKNKKYYWFEHAWEKYIGIHSYDTKEELLLDVKNKFILNLKNSNNFDIAIYEYQKPKFNISLDEFFKHCESSFKISSK